MNGNRKSVLVSSLIAIMPVESCFVELDNSLEMETLILNTDVTTRGMITWGIFRLASLAGTRSASSDPCHLIKKKRSPGSLVAPMILSGFKPLEKPRGFASSDFFEP